MGGFVKEVPYLVVSLAISWEMCTASMICSGIIDLLQEEEEKGRHILRLNEKVSSAPSMALYIYRFSRLKRCN